MNKEIRLYDFNVYDEEVEIEESSIPTDGFGASGEYKKKEKKMKIQMFGMDEKGIEYSIYVEDFKPFFYLKVFDHWGKKDKESFMKDLLLSFRKNELRNKYRNDGLVPWETKPRIFEDETEENYVRRTLKTYISGHEDSIDDVKLVKREKLYGFDNFKKYKFILIKFKNMNVFNKLKRIWYTDDKDFRKRKLKKHGYIYKEQSIYLYEGNLPPLLRYFHVTEISPSGWIKIKDKYARLIGSVKTNCDYEITINYKNMIPLLKKETIVPLKIMSWDIEASSSHGDFPLAKKTYRKLASEIIQHWIINKIKIKILKENEKKLLFKRLIMTAFKYDNVDGISNVFLKHKKSFPTKEQLDNKINYLLNYNIGNRWTGLLRKKYDRVDEDEKKNYDELDEETIEKFKQWTPRIPKSCVKNNIIYLLNCARTDDGSKFDVGDKLDILDRILEYNPRFKKMAGMDWPLQGDKVTFIGSTFMRFGETGQYLNHMIALDNCDEMPNVENPKLECYKSEKKRLLAWINMIKKEKPNIILGYNIFGFDWKFMIQRADELKCMSEFLMLSRNKNEKSRIKETEIKIASGTHELMYVKMIGCLQVDLYNYFRREVNLPSYKLDNVASHFIGDIIQSIEYNDIDKTTKISSNNLMGLKRGHYICFEILGHSSDKYKDGKKFIIKLLNEVENYFIVDGNIEIKNMKCRWCLAKDDVSPQDIFRLSNGNSKDKAIVAKYCIQDCNLVHNLMIKNDILTGMIEVASITSVPVDFIIMRGQGIKLLSFIAKKCREKRTLMPTLEKSDSNDGYEGAICLKPKCGFYSDNPIAVNDYSSLYPSSMISENISHDSKVWTKEYDLEDNLIKVTGIKDMSDNFIYDNLKDYKYVNIKYDTYRYERKTSKAKEEKVCCGYKVCRYVQFKNDKKAIMPSVLQELLASRKATRTMAKYKNVCDKNKKKYVGLLKKKDGYHIIIGKDETNKILDEDVVKVEDTFDDFMKNVLDKRQLGYKVTANSLYGQCGAKTSAFYDKDIAASTTAVGRKLLIYAKNILEECYGDNIVETRYGKMQTRAEYIYGDSVTHDTPLLLKNKKTGYIEFKQIDNISNEDWSSYEGFKIMDSNRREKQQNMVKNYKIYTSNGWSDINRVIRHKTIKNIYRITTHTGMVDVTEDHSLLDENGKIIKPTEVKCGMKLLHNYPSFKNNKLKLNDILTYIKNIGDKTIEEKEAFIYGFFFGDGSCGKYNCTSGKKYSWAINQKNIEMCVVLQSLLMEVYNESFSINDTIQSSGVYKIVPSCGNIKKYAEMYRSVCYNKDKYKIIPNKILNGNYGIRYAYFAGYYGADGSKCPGEKAKTIRMSNKGKIGSAMLYYLSKSIGFNVSVNTRSDKLNITRLTCTNGKQRKENNIIKKIELISENYDSFVYDIETVTGNFNTGYPLIVKNTDSVFYTFNLEDLEGEKVRGKKALQVTIDLAVEVEKIATKFLKPPHTYEYEKTFMPLLLLAKKKYTGTLYEFDVNKCKNKSMGIVLKRRDNAACVKDGYGGIVDILMKDGDVDKAVIFIKKYLIDMVKERIPLEKLIISKSLRGFYKNPQSIAHKVLADRIGKRDPGNKPSIGSRIPYIYIQTNKKVELQGDRIENPNYIKTHKLKPDYTFYITNQLMKPIQQLFGLVLCDMKIFKRFLRNHNSKLKRIRERFKDDEKKCMQKITKEINKQVKLLIFDESLRSASNIKTGQRSLTDFFGKKK